MTMLRREWFGMAAGAIAVGKVSGVLSSND
jgi:hypothetical protein